MNSLEYLEGKHQEFVESLINLSMTPLHVIRDMISIAKWEDSPATNGLGARWTLLVPEAPEFHHLSGAVPFKIDLKASTICMMVRLLAMHCKWLLTFFCVIDAYGRSHSFLKALPRWKKRAMSLFPSSTILPLES